MRLVKYLAHAGVASRRKAEVVIRAGRVAVGGQVVTDPAFDVGEGAVVEVDGRAVEPEASEVWLVNKPRDVTSTAREPGRRQAVVELVQTDKRLYPVGRLDADSTGLLILTNDGELANRLMHPRYGVRKAYRAKLARPVGETQLRRLRKGVELEDGMTWPANVERLGERMIEIEIGEGRNRQVRRMLEAVGNEVAALERVRFGPLSLGRMQPGEARPVTAAELRGLRDAAGL
jgi:23S rRNA pseudouridine2605 synthase